MLTFETVITEGEERRKERRAKQKEPGAKQDLTLGACGPRAGLML